MTTTYELTFTRHEADKAAVARGDKPHLRFNKKLGLAYVHIIQHLKHYKGDLAGQPLRLEPWQQKLTAILFGWQRLNDRGQWVRRFNTALIQIPRKNGKTILGSAFSIADTIIRGEQGGEVVYFATKRKQASLAWNGTRAMMLSHPDIKKRTKVAYSTITLDTPARGTTTFDTLGRDSDTEDGLNVLFGLADEYHAHPDNSLWNVVESSMGSRREPIMLAITTAGFDVESPAYAMYEYAKKVLEGSIEDDTFFAFIAEATADADPFDEETWRMANPNYGVSVTRDYMQRMAATAQARPEARTNFLVKNLNIWVSHSEEFVPFSDWKACAGTIPDDLSDAITGADLSIVDDFTSVVDVYRRDGIYYVRARFYLPEDGLLERERELRVPLVSWATQGYITTTPGKTIDYDYLFDDIAERIDDMEAFCYDPYKAKPLTNRIEEELGFEECIPIRQGFLTLSSPMAMLRDLVREGRLVHEDNPVLNWMFSNVAVLRDKAGNIKPDKSKPRKKIDGIAALINSLAYLIHDQEPAPHGDSYETRGMLSL